MNNTVLDDLFLDEENIDFFGKEGLLSADDVIGAVIGDENKQSSKIKELREKINVDDNSPQIKRQHLGRVSKGIEM